MAKFNPDFYKGTQGYDELSINALLKYCRIAEDIDYPENDRDFFSVMERFFHRFNIDKNIFKVKYDNSKQGQYMKIKKKYWGIFFEIVRETYADNEDDEECKYNYLHYFRDDYDTIDEFKEKELIDELVSGIEYYCKNMIKNKEQKLYKSPIECTDIYNQRATKDIKIPFDCLRYHQNEYLMDKIHELSHSDDKAQKFMRYIIKKFGREKEFLDVLDNPFQDEKLPGMLGIYFDYWKDTRAELMKNTDYPTSSSLNYEDCFSEEEFYQFIEGITTEKSLNYFYSNIKSNYSMALKKLQSIVDMDYIICLYELNNFVEEKDEKYHYSSEKLVSEIDNHFENTFQKLMHLPDNIKDKVHDSISETFCGLMAKAIAINVVDNNKYLKDTIKSRNGNQ